MDGSSNYTYKDRVDIDNSNIINKINSWSIKYFINSISNTYLTPP
jgi:hypothetical protein